MTPPHSRPRTTPAGAHRRPQRRLGVALAAALWLGAAGAQALPELRFQEFFSTAAASPRISAALRQADGHAVRLTGYMVQQERPAMGRFMLTPRPVHMSEHADGDADDLPLAWAMVYLDASQQDFAVPHVRGLIELSGILHVGRLEEEDGRVSWVRLQLAPEATRGMNGFEVANYLHSLQHIH